VGDDIKVVVNVIDSTGAHAAATIDTTTTRLNGYSAAPTVNTIATGIYEIVFSGVTPAPAEGDRLIAKINGTVTSTGTAWTTYGVPVVIVADERGTDSVTSLDAAGVRTAVGLASANLDTQLNNINTQVGTIDGIVDDILVDTGTDIPASIAALNNFDPTTDQVIVGTNTDKTDYALSSAANDAIGAAFLAYTLTKGTAGTIERAFWQALKATQLADGEVSGTPTASAFDTNLTAVTGAYNHLLLLFTSGSLAGEARPIATYNSTNGRITLQEALTSAPSSSDEFIVVPDHSHPVSEIVEGIFNEPQAGYTTAGTFGYYLDSQVSAAGGAVDTAAIADAVWDESRSGHTTSGTFGYYLDAQVSTAGSGGSGLYQVSVLVQDASNAALQGARINVDGTVLTLTTDSSGIVTFNLDSGVYLLTCSPPAGFDTPTSLVATVTNADVSKEFTLTPTSSAPCDVPWVG